VSSTQHQQQKIGSIVHMPPNKNIISKIIYFIPVFYKKYH